MPDHWRYYLGLFRRVWGRLAFGSAFLVLQSFLYIPVVRLVQTSFDVDLPNGDWNAVLRNGLLAVALLLANTAMGIRARGRVMAMSKTVIANLHADVIKRLLSFSRQRYTAADIPGMQHSVVIESDCLETMNYMVFTQMLPGILNASVLGAVPGVPELELAADPGVGGPGADGAGATRCRRFIRRAFVHFQAAMRRSTWPRRR